ncbi:hypothetical protein C7412_112202 [Paraburkholderia silvatlantica]|nr:hypothetical protein C7412_112202 [Paraburkholderia silvatlantica]
MHTVCLPTSVWRANAEAVDSLLHQIADLDVTSPVFMVADAASVVRRPGIFHGVYEKHDPSFTDWVRIGYTSEGVLDIERIRSACAEFPARGIVLLKASAFESQLIVRALHELRIGMHLVETWPAVFAVVCDDSQIFQLAPSLSKAFYLQPSIINPAAEKRIAVRLAKEGKSLRLLGRSVGALPRLARLWTERRRRSEDRRIKRDLGWIWEE